MVYSLRIYSIQKTEMIDNLYFISDYIKTDTGFECMARLNDSHPVYKGHFPGMPVMPGVCIMEMVKACVSKFLNIHLSYSMIQECKFLIPVLPDKDRVLKIHVDLSPKNQDSFVSYKINCQIFSEDLKVKLKAMLSSKNDTL